jgi:hypothetical protein
MKRFLFALSALALAGCGYVTNVTPPRANVPAAIQKLDAWQRGANIVTRFDVPKKTTEGEDIKPPLKMDLRIGPGGEPFNVDEWAARARRVEGGKTLNGVATFEASTAELVGREVVAAVRVAGANGKFSDWSNYAIVEVVPTPEQPADLRAVATPQGVRLTWSAKGQAFRIYRRTGDEANSTAVATVDRPEWLDADTDFGKRYAYSVETFAKLGRDKEARSEVSSEIAITPQDEFPPAAPTGLHANAAPNSIELIWEPNAEAFLGSYRVYRAVGSGAFQKLADIGMIPNYSDRAVEPGKTYRYQITAMSRTGHESPRSAAAEAALP